MRGWTSSCRVLIEEGVKRLHPILLRLTAVRRWMEGVWSVIANPWQHQMAQ